MPEFPFNYAASSSSDGGYRLSPQGYVTEYSPASLYPEAPKHTTDPDIVVPTAAGLMEGANQIPPAKGKNYHLASQEVSGLDIHFAGHNGWIRTGVCFTFTDGKALEPLHTAREAALESACRSFEALRQEFSKGPEAEKVRTYRAKVEQLKAQAHKHAFDKAQAERKLEESYETDSPYAQWEQAHSECTSKIKANAHLLKIFNKRLEEAEAAYLAGWVKVRDEWLQAQTAAHMSQEARMEEEMVRELALKSAALETQQALSREYCGSYYTSAQAPEIQSAQAPELPAPTPAPLGQ